MQILALRLDLCVQAENQSSQHVPRESELQ